MSKYLRKDITVEDMGMLQQQPPICDFCGAHAPAYLYASRRMSTGEARMCWRWCACPDCEQEIETNRFDRIRDRIVQTLHDLYPAIQVDTLAVVADVSLNEFHQFAIKPEGEKS